MNLANSVANSVSASSTSAKEPSYWLNFKGKDNGRLFTLTTGLRLDGEQQPRVKSGEQPTDAQIRAADNLTTWANALLRGYLRDHTLEPGESVVLLENNFLSIELYYYDPQTTEHRRSASREERINELAERFASWF